MARVLALVQARMGSSRLPGKVIAEVCGRPILWHIVDRLSHCRTLSAAVIATSAGSDCEAIREVAARYGLACYSGSEQDLIDRLLRAAQASQADAVVRVTADCPFVDPVLVDRMVTTFETVVPPLDCVVNYVPRTFPHGLDLEVYRTSLLDRLWEEIEDVHDREWFPTYVTARAGQYSIGTVRHAVDLSGLRWTVDYPEDLEFCRAAFEALWREGEVFGMTEMLALLERQPELAAMNAMHHLHGVRPHANVREHSQ